MFILGGYVSEEPATPTFAPKPRPKPAGATSTVTATAHPKRLTTIGKAKTPPPPPPSSLLSDEPLPNFLTGTGLDAFESRRLGQKTVPKSTSTASETYSDYPELEESDEGYKYTTVNLEGVQSSKDDRWTFREFAASFGDIEGLRVRYRFDVFGARTNTIKDDISYRRFLKSLIENRMCTCRMYRDTSDEPVPTQSKAPSGTQARAPTQSRMPESWEHAGFADRRLCQARQEAGDRLFAQPA